MNMIKSLAVLCAAVVFTSPAVDGATINLTFDGTTDGGWTISNQPDDGPVPTADVEGTGLPGIAFDDMFQGPAYYMAPADLTSMDLSGMTLNFNFWIKTKDSTLIDDDAAPDLTINGMDIALDVIDESQLDTLQAITVDFTNPAFDGIDLANITSFGIRAEYWSNGGESVESYLVGVPEPASLSLAAFSLCGLILRRRKK
jgi:hypothetical protein